MPPAGDDVPVKKVINDNRGSDNATVTHLLHSSIIATGARAVSALGARFAGIDIITKDLTVPLADAGGVVIEVNGTPNLYYHYHKADGVTPVAKILLQRLLKLDRGSSPRSHDVQLTPIKSLVSTETTHV